MVSVALNGIDRLLAPGSFGDSLERVLQEPKVLGLRVFR